MSYPNLETCEIIGLEFPESESVWIREEDPYVERASSTACGFNKILAPAPTNEELGVWLWENGKYQLSHHTDLCYKLSNNLGDSRRKGKAIIAKNETQARAEAVKFILEQQC